MSAFGLDLIEIKRLADDAHALRVHEAREVEAALVDFEERFPQLFFSVYLGVLPPPLSVGELGFLLLNRGVFWAEYHPRLNEHAVVLVLDPETRQAGLMVGYALEKVLPIPVQERILRAVRTPLWHAEYARAITAIVGRVARVIRRHARRAWRRDVLPPTPAEDFLGGGGFRSLRQAPQGGESGRATDEPRSGSSP